MQLADGYIDLPPGKLANIQTNLEMLSRPKPAPVRAGTDSSCRLTRLVKPDAQRYRELFKRVGEPYLWSSRLAITNQELLDIIHDDAEEVYAVQYEGRECGLLELDFRTPDECELTFLGLTGDAVGRGIGRWVMNQAIDRAWSKPIRRFWVHTCNLDHPSALPFYIRSGFVPFKRQIEIMQDPRMIGLLSKDAAPHIPLL